MKTRLFPLLFALVSLFGASHSAVAAPKKADERAAALVAALQAVSPDPLGGRLGLAATTARPAGNVSSSAPTATRGLTAENARAELDRRAYLVWKSSQKS
jgi:hypothetical protein